MRDQLPTKGIIKKNKNNKNAYILTFHIEALPKDRILKAIDKIHRLGKKVGLSIKPATPASEVIPYVDLVEMVLVMTVEPGFGGQSFMYETMDKVKEIREYSSEIDIQVDGGINNDTIKIAKEVVLGEKFKSLLKDTIEKQ